MADIVEDADYLAIIVEAEAGAVAVVATNSAASAAAEATACTVARADALVNVEAVDLASKNSAGDVPALGSVEIAESVSDVHEPVASVLIAAEDASGNAADIDGAVVGLTGDVERTAAAAFAD